MVNATCNVYLSSYKIFFNLNKKCTNSWLEDDIPITSLLYSLSAVVSILAAIITYYFYNSVKVLNYSIYISAISNSWWIIYFFIMFVRSVLLAIQYAHSYTDDEFFLTNWIIGMIEISTLCFALDYQRKYRNSIFIKDEIDDVGKDVDVKKHTSNLKGFLRVVTTSGPVIILEFIIAVVFVIMLRYMDNYLSAWFWIYIMLLSLLLINTLSISILIGCKRSVNEPYKRTKVYFILAASLNTLEHLPVFIWKNCVDMQCWDPFTVYDLLVVFKILSTLFFFRALLLEYNRLKHECQYAVLNEVQGYTFDS